MRFMLVIAILFATIEAYWLADIQHQGLAPFAGGGYKVFRNVKDYGARGDGSTDDTAAIQRAIDDGNRCGRGCSSTTTTPALVYFPAGTYLVSTSIKPQYITQLVGDPTNVPTLKATSGFSGFGIIDGDPYYTSELNWGSTNVFYRQVRNFVIDSTNVNGNNGLNLMHWPTAQATSLQNIVFNMPGGSQHVGLFIESGSGGFMGDLTFKGGLIGANLGNQQFTLRNIAFDGCDTAINQIWNWGWTYIGLDIKNSRIGIDVSNGGSGAQAVGSITLLDSSISSTSIGIKTARTSSSTPDTGGSIILENVSLNNVPTAVQGPSGTVLQGGSLTIAAWGQGHSYAPNGPQTFQGTFTANARPSSLLNGNKYRTVARPQYQSLGAQDFVSARSSGAKGDGSTDDTAALQNGINSANSAGKVFYLDFGLYKVTNTITIPPGARIIGEAYPTIMSSGNAFANQGTPRAVIKVGSTSGQSGRVELTDFIVSTQGAQAGATLIEYNLASQSGSPSGMWDVHTRIGGFQGSNLQIQQCPKSPGNQNPPPQCVAAYMSFHATSGSSGLYMENNWLWVADHDIDSASNTQEDIYAGRGLYIESTNGAFWLVGTSSEHHVLYQYQFANTKNIFAGQIQTESPYWQPSPPAPRPFTSVASLNDPVFNGALGSAYGLRIYKSSAIKIYGAGLYSFFDSWGTNCVTFDNGSDCQPSISVVTNSQNVEIYNLNTVGVVTMINGDNNFAASYTNNKNGFASTIARYTA